MQADARRQQFAVAARPEQIDRSARALAAHAFSVEVLDDARAARVQVADRTTVLLVRESVGF